jgi:hypothetical protein
MPCLPLPVLPFHNIQVFYDDNLLATAQSTSWRTIPSWLSITAHLIYLHLSSTSDNKQALVYWVSNHVSIYFQWQHLLLYLIRMNHNLKSQHVDQLTDSGDTCNLPVDWMLWHIRNLSLECKKNKIQHEQKYTVNWHNHAKYTP